MSLPRTIAALALFATLTHAAGCGDTALPSDAGPDDVDSGTDADDAGQTADTWENYAAGFTTTYCTSCHSPGGDGYRNGSLDFRTLDDVVTTADESRCGVAPTQLEGCSGFPPPAQFPIAAPYPTDAERLRFVRWIEDGLLP